MRAKALSAAFAVLTTVCSTTSWADGSLAPDLDFYTLGPCRVVDTRAGAPLTSGTPRTFQVSGSCGVPGTAKALAITVTVVGPTANGFVTLWPADLPEPATSTINFSTAMTRANNAMATLATDGSGELSAKAFLADSGSVHLIIDVTGYLAGDPLPPCLCPIDGIPFPMIFGVNPTSGGVGMMVAITGQNLPPNPQVLFGDATTGSSAPIVSSSSTTIHARVPAPSFSFTFSTEPCDANQDGIVDGTRNIPTPINVNAQSLDGTGCVVTLVNAFTLMPADTTCTAGPPNDLGTATMTRATKALATLGGAPVTQCQCPTNGMPLPQILAVTPSSGAVGLTVTISGESFRPAMRVVFGDAVTGSSAQILSSSSTAITARVPTPPPGFTFATEPCDGNGDGISAGTRYLPTPIDVSVRTLDGTSCVSTLSNAFTLTPPNTTCTGDTSTPPPAPR